MSVQQSFFGLESDVWLFFERPGPVSFGPVEALNAPDRGRPLLDRWPTDVVYLLPPGVPSEEVEWRPLKAQEGMGILTREHSPVVELYVASPRVALAPSRIWLGATQVTPYRREAMSFFKALQRKISQWPRCLPSGHPVGPAAEAAVRAGSLQLADGVQVQTLS